MSLNPRLRPTGRPPQITIRENQRRRLGSSVVQFPHDLGENKMVFTFKPYVYRTPGPTITNSASVDFSNTGVELPPTNTVVLPLPTNLQDQNEARLSRFDGNYIGDKLARFAQNMGNNTGMSFADAFKKSAGDAFGTGAGKNIANMVYGAQWQQLTQDMSYLTKFGGETMRKAFSAGTGAVANPKASLIYEGHELKNHSFVWTFAPRSREESESLKNIINYIKYCQLPILGGTAEGGLHLKYPMMVDIQLFGLQEDYFYSFKTCMIRSFNVNYSGQNSVAILEGGKPAVINMEMNLMEMDIHYATEMENSFGGVLRPDSGRFDNGRDFEDRIDKSDVTDDVKPDDDSTNNQ